MDIERKISRREFLIGAVSAAVLAGCKKLESFTPIPQPTLTPIEKPTETSQPTPTKAPQPTDTSRPTTVPTPEPTPTPEPKRISATTITQEYLKSAFAGIGGGEMVEGEKEKMSLIEFGQDYVSQTWGEEVDFKTLPEDPIASLKYLVSLGSYRGEEGIFSPGKQGEEVIFPQIGDLSLARLTLKNIPSQTEQEYKEWITPLNFLLRPGTQMTVVGEFKTREEAEFNYALVAFTDYLRASEESGVPRHYLVIIPTLTLANLLEANKYEFNPQTDEITIAGENGQKTILGLNQIKSEELTDKIRKACGLYFVDQIKGELIKNPVVPYPQEMPSVWEIEEIKDEESNVNLILRGQDQEGKFQDFSRARYDGEKEEWVWKGVETVSKPFDKIAVPNVFAFPGWVKPGVVIRNDGSLVADSIKGAYATYVANETTSLAVEGDFEVQWKMVTTVKGDPKTRGFGVVFFYNRSPRKVPDYLEVGISEENKFYAITVERKTREGTDLNLGTIAPPSGSLRIRFEGVNTGSPETLILFDGDTGKEAGRTQLPFQLFSTGELSFGLYVINPKEDPRGVEMTVSPMKILVPAESQNIKLR